VSKLTNVDFARQFANHQLNAQDFLDSQEVKDAISGASGSSRFAAAVQNAAGGDGEIRTPDQVALFFNAIDIFDHNGDPKSLQMQKSDGSPSLPAVLVQQAETLFEVVDQPPDSPDADPPVDAPADAPADPPQTPAPAGDAGAAGDATFDIDSRSLGNIATLQSDAQDWARAFYQKANAWGQSHGVEVKIISGTRTAAEQHALFLQRPKVTNADSWHSNHNFGRAWDVGLFKNGTYLEDSPLYDKLAFEVGQPMGLEVGAAFHAFQDDPHYQVPTVPASLGSDFATMKEMILAGKKIPLAQLA
jgi:peptidoglycan L-alanyl-D-glutamate endopeptidase CwlK